MIFYILISSVLAVPVSAYLLRNYFSTPPLHSQLSIENMKSVLVLGGSFAGVSTAHRLLKKNPDVKVTLVAPNDALYWNMAGPRAIVPGGFADEKLFAPTGPGFKQYGDRFQFVLGTAESLDVATKSVTVKSATGEKAYSYDLIILATGSSTKGDIPYKVRGSTEDTKASLHHFQAQVKKAETIVVAGSGATGVETAGELGFEYGTKKKIILISSGKTILEGTPAAVSKAAISQLTNLKVTIKLETKVQGVATTPSGVTELTLSDGSKLNCDLYLPSTGLVPNSQYVPSSLLNQNGYVLVDEFLHVQGTTDAWVVGDVSSVQRPQYVNTEKQSTHVVKNIGLALKGQPLVKYPVGGADMLAVPIGKKSGTGHMGSMKFPGFVVNMVKGKTYFTQKLASTADGSSV